MGTRHARCRSRQIPPPLFVWQICYGPRRSHGSSCAFETEVAACVCARCTCAFASRGASDVQGSPSTSATALSACFAIVPNLRATTACGSFFRRRSTLRIGPFVANSRRFVPSNFWEGRSAIGFSFQATARRSRRRPFTPAICCSGVIRASAASLHPGGSVFRGFKTSAPSARDGLGSCFRTLR